MGFRSKLKPNVKKLMSTLHKTKGYVLFHPFPHITLFLTFIAEGSLPKDHRRGGIAEGGAKTSRLAEIENFAFGQNQVGGSHKLLRIIDPLVIHSRLPMHKDYPGLESAFKMDRDLKGEKGKMGKV